MKNHHDTIYREYYAAISKIVKGEELPPLTPEEITKYGINPGVDEEKCIPGYWKAALTNSKFFLINDKDEKILEHLIDIRIKPTDSILNFMVEFEFSPNSFFSESVLTKMYYYDEKTEEIVKTTGCQIHWSSQDINPRVKKVTKSVKSKKYFILHSF
jgi:hypothetical protein